MTRRLVTSYLAVTLIVLAALEIPLAITYRDRQIDQLSAGLERDAFVLAAYIEDTLGGVAEQDLQAIADGYAQRTDGRVVIVDADADVLADTAPAAPGERNFATRPEISAALQRDVVSGTRASSTLGSGLVYVAVPVASGEQVLGAVRVSYSTDQLDDRVRSYWMLLLAAAVLTMAVVGGLGYLLARWVTRPLDDLRTAATRIGDGDLETRADQTHGPPEVRALAEAFNTTAVRLEQLVTAQEQFVADASHQLRTPLTALRLRLEVLEDDTAPDASEDLAAARNEVLRLSRLVDGLLALARAERATGATLPPPVELALILEDRCLAWQPVASDRAVELSSDSTGLSARATPDHLGQALDNLIANALEVAPEGSTVRVWATPTPTGEVEVHVTDQGPGMTPEQRQRAFDRFWRANAAPSELGGSGLGLAIVQKLVVADGGRVDLREAPKGGLDAVLLLQTRS
ncbi:MAG TPA: ATP-binding protein [Acidimicrobiales bacterium]